MLDALIEVMVPAKDLVKSVEFYLALGYKLEHEEDWGMAILKHKSGGAKLALYKQDFFKEPALGYRSRDLDQVVDNLKCLNIELKSDDRANEPSRISFVDPSGLDITVFQG